MIAYKYLPFRSKEGSNFFENFLLRYTQPSELNDPYECSPLITRVESSYVPLHWQNMGHHHWFEKIEDLTATGRELYFLNVAQGLTAKIQSGELDEQISRIEVLAKKNLDENFGLLSLSKRRDHQLMWAHYAESASGYAVGFDLSHDYFMRPKWEPVKYSEERAEAPLSGKAPYLYTEEQLLTKHNDWSYEEEIRHIRPLGERSKLVAESICLFSIPQESIRCYIFGPKTSDEDMTALLKATEKHSLKVNFFRAQLRKGKFGFDILEFHPS